MKEELNLQCLYSVSFDTKKSVYSFTTSNAVEYNLAFVEATGYFAGTSTEFQIQQVYTLNIDKVSPQKAPLDSYVQEAVNCIVKHFFANKANSLIYVCDTSDDKQLARRRKFNKWYNDSAERQGFKKIDKSITTPDDIYFASIIFHIQNPFAYALETGFYEVIDSLNKPE